MKSISTLALVAALALAPTAIFAQDVNADVSGAMSADASAATSALDTSAAADANASASASGTLTFDDLLGDIGSDDWEADVTAATAAGADATINIVEVSSLEGSADASTSAVTDATASNGDRIAALQAAVGANAAIQAKLTAAGHDTDDVVAVKTDADGAIWVYVDEAE